jgi:hypothetical protein
MYKRKPTHPDAEAIRRIAEDRRLSLVLRHQSASALGKLKKPSSTDYAAAGRFQSLLRPLEYTSVLSDGGKPLRLLLNNKTACTRMIFHSDGRRRLSLAPISSKMRRFGVRSKALNSLYIRAASWLGQ